MRSLIYILVEGLTGIKRSKVSSFFTIFTVAISLLLLGTFYVGSKNIIQILSNLKKRIRLEVFVDNAATGQDIQRLKQRIEQQNAVDSLRFVSRRQALEIYKRVFGPDYVDIIEENPLPASFQIVLKPAYLNDDSARVLVEKLRTFENVDEVVYRGAVLRIMNHYLKLTIYLAIAVGIGLGFLSFFLIANNIRLTIYAKRRIIETMRLVGATPSMIWGPFFIQGSLEGLLGGGLAALMLLSMLHGLSLYFETKIFVPEYTLSGLLLLGAMFGVVGSIFGVRRQS
ncbi:MAG: ABC transporter permease [Calditrichaeota bacterium]|nr:MAG: ABC transporter permease [Calditrichota bacterium]